MVEDREDVQHVNEVDLRRMAVAQIGSEEDIPLVVDLRAEVDTEEGALKDPRAGKTTNGEADTFVAPCVEAVLWSILHHNDMAQAVVHVLNRTGCLGRGPRLEVVDPQHCQTTHVPPKLAMDSHLATRGSYFLELEEVLVPQWKEVEDHFHKQSVVGYSRAEDKVQPHDFDEGSVPGWVPMPSTLLLPYDPLEIFVDEASWEAFPSAWKLESPLDWAAAADEQAKAK